MHTARHSLSRILALALAVLTLVGPPAGAQVEDSELWICKANACPPGEAR